MIDPVTRLNAALEGRYAIERELGEGGMATVYLAEDIKHNRKVALKVLKPELAAVVGAERFLAEITTTANLTHPHILPLHDSGEADGFLFYVMPYVEGESLRERLDREHQLPVDEAVRIASDVAEALQYAHDHGVIHRDIKPANILVQAGRPVISDFGIALAIGVAGGGRLTETGLSLGTPHYMSPEQATGDLNVGAGTDIYALGCVLYEMLVGEPPYTGSTPQAVLGKIIAGELASATKQRTTVPPNVDAVIRRALERVPADRFRSAGGFADALLDDAFKDQRMGPAVTSAGAGSLGVGLAWLVAGIAIGSVAVGALRSADEVEPVAYFPLRTPEGVNLIYDLGRTTVAVSPTGEGVVYVGQSDQRRLYWQDLHSPGDAVPIPGTEGALAPFVSPDGEWIGFLAGNTLSKVSLRGGDPVPLAQVAIFNGGAWSHDGETIYFVPTLRDGIWRISANGGQSSQVTVPAHDGLDENHHWPSPLPDGEGLIYTRCCAERQVVHLDLATGTQTTLVQNAFGGRYTPSGHLVFAQPGRLMAARFDLESLNVGPAVEVFSGLVTGLDFHSRIAP